MDLKGQVVTTVSMSKQEDSPCAESSNSPQYMFKINHNRKTAIKEKTDG